MSRVRLEYEPAYVGYLAEDLEMLLDGGFPEGTYSEDVLEKFRATVEALNKGAAMVKQVGNLLSGDSSEESFRENWAEILKTHGE